MANGKTKNKKLQKCGNSVPKKMWRKIVGDPLLDGEKKQKIASIPGRPRRFLPPITPHKERCNYVHIAEYGSTG